MKKIKILMLLSTTLILLAAQSADAGSIWAKRNQKITNVYADDVARNVGDVLTIQISEDSKVDNKAKRDLGKSTNRAMEFNGELGSYADIGDFGFDSTSNNSLSGKADYKDERSFEDSVTVVVVDILPNGNLVFLGTRTREIAGDTQEIEVSGVVRPSDIEFDNTVHSERVADFHLVTKNSGVADPYTKPGWFGSLLDKIWPF